MTRGPAEYRLQWNKEWIGDNHGISFQEIRMWKEMSTFGYLLINPIIYMAINSDFFLVMQLPFYIHRPNHTQFVLRIRSKQFGIIKAVSVQVMSLWHHLCCCMLSHSVLPDFATPWTIALQAPPSMGFFRKWYWSALPFPPSEHLPNPGIKPASLVFPTLAGGTT